MNIFWLHRNNKICARYACNQHIVKMCIEYAQMLCTTISFLGIDPGICQIYKSTHANHPCTLWVKERYSNFMNLWYLLFEYNLEYKRRFNKSENHKSYNIIQCLITLKGDQIREAYINLYGPQTWEMSLPPMCMPDEYKTLNPRNINDITEAYRKFYRGDKSSFARYRTGEIPEFMQQNINMI